MSQRQLHHPEPILAWVKIPKRWNIYWQLSGSSLRGGSSLSRALTSHIVWEREEPAELDGFWDFLSLSESPSIILLSLTEIPYRAECFNLWELFLGP